MEVDERGKNTSTSTILEEENACQGQGLVSGLLFRWILAAVLCLLVGIPTLQSNRSATLDSRLHDEAIRKTDITLALLKKMVSKSKILGLTRIGACCVQGR